MSILLRHNFLSVLVLLVTLILVQSCSVKPSRYSISQDKAPVRDPTASELQDIEPQALAYSRGGNKDYTVRGISYRVLKDVKGFEQTGIASWYGAKFHGHLTSNGETYNMFTLSAAHKS
ncbi:MAG: septal ring lytic transglycosylase RlpA, partial [Psychrobium sp.]|nr:septal ring lytic transglycosylase RlpA [Psychrobium sp.]